MASLMSLPREVRMQIFSYLVPTNSKISLSPLVAPYELDEGLTDLPATRTVHGVVGKEPYLLESLLRVRTNLAVLHVPPSIPDDHYLYSGYASELQLQHMKLTPKERSTMRRQYGNISQPHHRAAVSFFNQIVCESKQENRQDMSGLMGITEDQFSALEASMIPMKSNVSYWLLLCGSENICAKPLNLGHHLLLLNKCVYDEVYYLLYNTNNTFRFVISPSVYESIGPQHRITLAWLTRHFVNMDANVLRRMRRLEICCHETIRNDNRSHHAALETAATYLARVYDTKCHPAGSSSLTSLRFYLRAGGGVSPFFPPYINFGRLDYRRIDTLLQYSLEPLRWLRGVEQVKIAGNGVDPGFAQELERIMMSKNGNQANAASSEQHKLERMDYRILRWKNKRHRKKLRSDKDGVNRFYYDPSLKWKYLGPYGGPADRMLERRRCVVHPSARNQSIRCGCYEA